jgi:hypothetical protein
MVKRETQKSKGANILGRREYVAYRYTLFYFHFFFSFLLYYALYNILSNSSFSFIFPFYYSCFTKITFSILLYLYFFLPCFHCYFKFIFFLKLYLKKTIICLDLEWLSQFTHRRLFWIQITFFLLMHTL